MTTLPNHERLLTTEREIDQARDVLDDLDGPAGSLAVERHGEHASELPEELGRILQHVIDVVSRGGTVTVGAVPEELTTSAAADLIGVSRPTLMKKIREEQIPAHKVGTHTRLKSSDVFDYLRARRARQRAAFEELLELEADED